MLRLLTPVFPAVLAFRPFCTPALRQTQPPALVQIEELWERPADLATLYEVDEGRTLSVAAAGG